MRAIYFYDKRLQPRPITDEQYERLKIPYAKGGVIEFNGELIDTKAIEGIFQISEESRRISIQNEYRPTKLSALLGDGRKATPRTPDEAREYVRKKITEIKERKKRL